MLKFVYFLFFLIFIIFSILFYFALDNYYHKESMKKIEQTLLFDKAIQTYVKNYIKPAIKNLQDQGLIHQNYFNPVLLSSTFAVRNINYEYQHLLKNSEFNSNKNIALKVASNNPTNSINKATKFESSVLKKINKNNLEEYSEQIMYEGKKTQFFAVAVPKNTKNCLRCHGNYKDAPKDMIKIYGNENGFNEKIGETRAIIALYNPIDEDQKNMMQFFYIVETLAVTILILLIVILTYYSNILKAKDALITRQTKFAAMGEMVSMIAHQWRQPLTGMGMTVENLKLDIELEDIDTDRWDKNLNIISRQITYLSNTINNFTNFFKPKQEAETFEIQAFILDTINIIGSSIKSNNINIVNNFNNDIKLTTHKNDLIQVVLNIINNAKDAYVLNNIDNRDIIISTYIKSHHIYISIKDNAGGIPNDIIDQIFDPYFSTKDEKNGTGLGLYMSKMIIEDHLNGVVEVKVVENSTEFLIKLNKKA